MRSLRTLTRSTRTYPFLQRIFSTMSSQEEKSILVALNELNIEHRINRHNAVLTCDQHLEAVSEPNVVLAKNLLIKKKKKLYLIITPAVKNAPTVSLKDLGKAIGIGTSVSMARKEKMMTVLKAAPGAVTPLGVIFDEANCVTVAIDKSMMEASSIGLHPGTNEATVFIKPEDLIRYLEKHSNTPQIVDFSAAPVEAAADEAKHEPKKSKSMNKRSGDEDTKKMTWKKTEDFGMWYAELVKKSELVVASDVSGCYVLRPAAMFMWDQIRRFMDDRIVESGVQNAYFPLFISEAALFKEKDHVEGFEPEVAWVTHSGKSKLANRVAVRPTSETVMYPIFKDWIRSHTDLPLRINQWCNVVRWEFKDPTPFLRTREFLWQEGHSCFATREEACEEVYEILDLYADTYSEMLAIPTIKGLKTENEKFPGADFTTTVEAYVPVSGRGIQGATSHMLGQNFGKMFNIKFQAQDKTRKIPWQNSWGYTTRSIGVMLMNHSDDAGLVVPPKVAQFQVVIVPIVYKEDAADKTFDKAREIFADLKKLGIRVHLDDRPGKNPGWKFSEWELKGVPLRLELGPKDMKNETVLLVRRDTMKKVSVSWADLEKSTCDMLQSIHTTLFQRAKRHMDDNIVRVRKWDDFLAALGDGKLVLAPSCNESKWEDEIGKRTKEYFDEADLDARALSGKAKALCIPMDGELDHKGNPYQASVEGVECIISGKEAKKWILFGRSY